MKPDRVKFGTQLDPKLLRRFTQRCDQRGLLIYMAVEDAVRDWLAKHGEVSHGG